MKQKLLCLLAAAAMLLSLAACGATGPDPDSPETASGTQTVVIEGFDWGPAVTKTILSLNKSIDPDSVKPECFAICEHKETIRGLPLGIHIVKNVERTVTAAYPCDAEGRAVEGASPWIALELAYAPSEGSPFCYSLLGSQNSLCDPYELKVSLAKGSTLTAADGGTVTGLAVSDAALQDAKMPQLERVDLSGRFTGKDGRELRYAAYLPEEDGSKHPLVIWLHGAGEGGTDPVIAVLGNEVTALFADEFQSRLGGAYVLAPQTLTFWMEYNEKGAWKDNPGTASVYQATLMELIESFVSQHPGIDVDRIYVGGCSNGGYMTMDLILNYPDFFAAAYPICESYMDSGISDEQLARIKDLPIWFVYAQNDGTVDPSKHEIPTVSRLKAMGADVHVSVFADVHDTSSTYTEKDGSPYQYNGHWSWIYFFNDECTENGLALWDWLALQSRAS